MLRILDLAVVAETLVKHNANVRAAAIELRVPVSDLRKLALANQTLLDAAYEAEEVRLDRAEAVVDEALQSDDSRRKDAAAFFVLRNMTKSKRRGWIPSSSASVDVNIQTNKTTQLHRFDGATDEDDTRDAEAAEAERLRDEGKLIEHEAGPEPSNKD